MIGTQAETWTDSMTLRHSEPDRLPNSFVLQTTRVLMRVLWSRGLRGSRSVPPGQNVSLQSTRT